MDAQASSGMLRALGDAVRRLAPQSRLFGAHAARCAQCTSGIHVRLGADPSAHIRGSHFGHPNIFRTSFGAAVASAVLVARCDDDPEAGEAVQTPRDGPDPTQDVWGVKSEQMLSNALAGQPVQLSLETSLLIVEGGRLMRDGQLALAETKYREAIKEVSLLDPASDAVIVLLHKVANICYVQGRWAEAADAFAAVARGLVHTAGRSMDDDSLIEISLKIADCYSMLGEHDAALSGYTWCCESSRAKVKAPSPPITIADDSDDPDPAATAENRRALLGMSLHALAGHLERCGNHSAAVEALEEALDVARTVSTGRETRIVDCHARLAAALAGGGDREAAVCHAETAATLSRQLGAEASPYIHLANLAILSVDNPRRRDMLDEALALAESCGNASAQQHIQSLLACA